MREAYTWPLPTADLRCERMFSSSSSRSAPTTSASLLIPRSFFPTSLIAIDCDQVEPQALPKELL